MSLSDRASLPLRQSQEQARLFVLDCVRRAVQPADAVCTAIDADSWVAIEEYGARHGVLPLVYEQYVRMANPSSPVTPEPLRRRYSGNAARNLALTLELMEISQRLADKGIRSLAMKGPVLSELAYGSVAFREYSDLDLLVPDQDVEQSCAVLSECGYRYWNKLGVPQRDERRLSYDHSFLRGDVHVELHWSLTPRRIGYAPDFEQLWSRRSILKATEPGIVSALSAEDHLLLICVHGAKHGWPRLGWVADLAGLIVRTPALDAHSIVQRACRWHVLRMLRIGLLLASRLCNVRVDAPFQNLLQGDAVAAELAAQIETRLLSPQSTEPDWRQSLGYQWASRERWRDRVRLLACTGTSPELPISTMVPGWVQLWARIAHFLTPNYIDAKRFRLPLWLSSMYYLIRPLRITAGAVRRLFGQYFAKKGQRVLRSCPHQ